MRCSLATLARPTRPPRAALVVVLCLAAAACGSKSKTRQSDIEVPGRHVTAGDRILAMAPAGANAVMELDLARLRGNAAVGRLVEAVTGAPAGARDLLGAADVLVVCSYRLGQEDSAQLVFAAGPRSGELAGARRVAPDLVAIGPASLLSRVDAVRAGTEPALSTDRALMRARALAMPDKAQGASLRMAASLDFDARLALAQKLQLDNVPSWISVWSDVADDFAAIALLGAEGAGDARDLARAVARVRDRVAGSDVIVRLGLGPVVASVPIAISSHEVKVVVVIGPRHLARLVERVLDRLRRRSPKASDDVQAAPSAMIPPGCSGRAAGHSCAHPADAPDKEAS